MEQIIKPRRFEFDRVFGNSPSAPAADTTTIALQLAAVQAELDHLRHDHADALAMARADGFDSALAHSRAERETALLAAVTSLDRGLAGLCDSFADTEARMTRTATEVAMAAAETLAARALSDNPTAAIGAAIGRVLAQRGARERLQLSVHPTLVTDIEALVAARGVAGQQPLPMTIHGDPALAPGDVVIVWDTGGLTLDAAARNAAVRAELDLAVDSAGPA
jgi:flagellar assembly protein FliH